MVVDARCEISHGRFGGGAGWWLPRTGLFCGARVVCGTVLGGVACLDDGW